MSNFKDPNEIDIVRNPSEFIKVFFDQVPNSQVSEEHEKIIRICTFFVWRGLIRTIKQRKESDLNQFLLLLSFSAYKSCLPIFQNIRLGHFVDVVVLLRILFERTSLLGYLNENQQDIQGYINGKRLDKDAIRWIKKKYPDLLPEKIYGVLSSVVHVNPASIKGYISERNPVSTPFHKYLGQEDTVDSGADSLTLILSIVNLYLLDLITVGFFQKPKWDVFPMEKNYLSLLLPDYGEVFKPFLDKFVSEVKEISVDK